MAHRVRPRRSIWRVTEPKGSVSPKGNVFGRLKGASSARWAGLKRRHPKLRHVVDAWNLLSANNGGQYAAAITYFSFLALFPLLLLAAAVTGFILHAHPAAQQSLLNHITANVPGDLGKTLRSSINTAISQRTGVGIIGLLGVLVTGLGWVGNLRAAINAVWGAKPAKDNFFLVKLRNLVVLVGLGLGVLVSLGLTDQILRGLGLDHVAGGRTLVTVFGLLLAIAGDVAIFWWMLARLPAVRVPNRIGLQGALLAAIGVEVLKFVGTYTIAATSHSPTAGPFAGLVAVLVWIQLVARYLLFCAAWTATALGAKGAASDAKGAASDAKGAAPAAKSAASDAKGAAPAAKGAAPASKSAASAAKDPAQPPGRQAGSDRPGDDQPDHPAGVMPRSQSEQPS
jgi:membrane protein